MKDDNRLNFVLRRRAGLLALMAGSALLTGCFGDDDDDNDDAPTEPVTASFEVTVTNLTAGQPLSPPALIAHQSGYPLFTIGEPASDAIEHIAESGDFSMLLSDAAASDLVLATSNASDPLLPGSQVTLTIELDDAELADAWLSFAVMLGNTNDGMAALQGVDLGSLAVGDSLMLHTLSYDAGTEANSESAATVPGPAAGGEGYNAERDDIRDQVTGHPGVVSFDGGLESSALSELQRWDNPPASVMISRVE